MTDRICALTVVLECDVRSDDAQPIIDAIGCIRGVESVRPIVSDTSLHVAMTRARSELRAKILAAFAEGFAAVIALQLTILAVLLMGCAPVPVKVFDERAESDGRNADAMRELPDEVVDACGVWGLACEANPDGNLRGDLVVMVTDHLGSGHGGRELASGWCAKAIWSELDVDALAHEIGHAFGLHHVEDAGNLMVADGYGGELGDVTDDQIDTVQAAADRFVGGC